MTKIGYARVSSADQDNAIQVAALRAAGCTVIRQEKASGSSTKGRTELETILDFIREGDTLVVTKLDRLSRNTIDMLGIITALGDKGVAFVSLAEPWASTDTPAGKLMLTVMAGVATFERERLKERQLEGIAKAKAAGAYKGRKPTIDAKAVQRLRAEGIGPAEIARRLKIGRASVYRALA